MQKHSILTGLLLAVSAPFVSAADVDISSYDVGTQYNEFADVEAVKYTSPSSELDAKADNIIESVYVLVQSAKISQGTNGRAVIKIAADNVGDFIKGDSKIAFSNDVNGDVLITLRLDEEQNFKLQGIEANPNLEVKVDPTMQSLGIYSYSPESFSVESASRKSVTFRVKALNPSIAMEPKSYGVAGDEITFEVGPVNSWERAQYDAEVASELEIHSSLASIKADTSAIYTSVGDGLSETVGEIHGYTKDNNDILNNKMEAILSSAIEKSAEKETRSVPFKIEE